MLPIKLLAFQINGNLLSFAFVLFMSYWANVFMLLNIESQVKKKKKKTVWLVFTSVVKTPAVNAKWFPTGGAVD